MKIRDKIVIGVGTYILITVLVGLYAIKELGTVRVKLNLIERTDDITQNIVEVRRYEKNFFLYRQQEDFDEVERHLGILQAMTDTVKDDIVKAIGADNAQRIKAQIVEYQSLFDMVARNLEAQQKLQSDITSLGRKIETRLSGKSLEIFSVLRRHEKNLILYRDHEHYAVFARVYASLPEIDAELRAYRKFVDQLVQKQSEEKALVQRLRAKGRDLQMLSETFAKEERAAIESSLIRTEDLLRIFLVIIIVLSVFVNTRLALRIAQPLKRLETITRKVAAGDFSERVDVTGQDEIASLEESFNKMEEKLNEAHQALEEKIQLLREKQSQLLEAEKHASIGVLAYGIAHEINNPLTSVLTFSNLLLEQTPSSSSEYEQLKIIARETEKVRIIVKQLLQYSREVTIAKVSVDLHDLVREELQTLRSQDVFQQITIEEHFDPSLPLVAADRLQLGQVIANILLNAAQAITPPGVIKITTSHDAEFVHIEISDTGSGIQPENLTKIFDPFFTTKPPGKGTGIGLALSYNIVKKHGGTIRVASEPGKGSQFTVSIPKNG
jgi:signal transduction histidine kinase